MGSEDTKTDERGQLAAIAQVAAALDSQGLDYWVFGGWGVDFIVGRQTRRHDDVDLAVWLRDRDRVHGTLLESGWEHTPFEDEVVATRYRQAGVLLELTLLVEGRSGQVMLPFQPEPVQWSAEPFGFERRTLGGVTARTLPLDRMLADKATPRDDPDDALKDRADHALLLAIVERPGRSAVVSPGPGGARTERPHVRGLVDRRPRSAPSYIWSPSPSGTWSRTLAAFLMAGGGGVGSRDIPDGYQASSLSHGCRGHARSGVRLFAACRPPQCDAERAGSGRPQP